MAKKKKETKYYREIMRASKRQTPNGNGKKPGEKARERQLASALSERRQFAAEADSPITGNVHTKQQIASARRGLKRQQNLRRKGSAY